MGEYVLVSACLVGVCSRFDGKTKRDDFRPPDSVCVIPVCPEQLGGLATPRPKSRLTGGTGADVIAGSARVINEEGADVTANFIRGARETATLARAFGVKRAYFKEKSPSCGVGQVYINETLTSGSGVTTALLTSMGIEVIPVD